MAAFRPSPCSLLYQPTRHIPYPYKQSEPTTRQSDDQVGQVAAPFPWAFSRKSGAATDDGTLKSNFVVLPIVSRTDLAPFRIAAVTPPPSPVSVTCGCEVGAEYANRQVPAELRQPFCGSLSKNPLLLARFFMATSPGSNYSFDFKTNLWRFKDDYGWTKPQRVNETRLLCRILDIDGVFLSTFIRAKEHFVTMHDQSPTGDGQRKKQAMEDIIQLILSEPFVMSILNGCKYFSTPIAHTTSRGCFSAMWSFFSCRGTGVQPQSQSLTDTIPEAAQLPDVATTPETEPPSYTQVTHRHK